MNVLINDGKEGQYNALQDVANFENDCHELSKAFRDIARATFFFMK